MTIVEDKKLPNKRAYKVSIKLEYHEAELLEMHLKYGDFKNISWGLPK